MLSLPLSVKFTHFGRLSATVKCGLLSLALIVSCALFASAPSYLREGPIDFKAPAYPIVADLTFTVEILSVEVESRTFMMDWYAGMSSCTPPMVADIYLDPSLLDRSSESFSSLPPYPPAYQYNNTAFCHWGGQMEATFRTVSKLVGLPVHKSATLRSTIYQYPFDKYVTNFGVYAINNKTGKAIPVNVTQSLGVAPGFDVSLDWAFTAVFNTTDDLVPQVEFALNVKRSKTTRLFAIVISITCWLVILGLVLASAAAIVYPLPPGYPGMFVLPVGAVLGLLLVRANLPGAPPGFGAEIDLFTVLPAVIILGFSSVSFLLVVLCRQDLDYEGKGAKESGPRCSRGKRRTPFLESITPV